MATEIVRTPKKCRAMEYTMGNLIADDMLDRFKDQGLRLPCKMAGAFVLPLMLAMSLWVKSCRYCNFKNALFTFLVKGTNLLAPLKNRVSQV